MLFFDIFYQSPSSECSAIQFHNYSEIDIIIINLTLVTPVEMLYHGILSREQPYFGIKMYFKVTCHKSYNHKTFIYLKVFTTFLHKLPADNCRQCQVRQLH